jgi:ATP-dependent Lon protease
METAQSNSQLAGSDEFWANSKPGAILELLVEGDWANPVVYVDEIDKASGGAHYDPLAALYGLLEPGTAKAFHDLSMPGIALDASRIFWILTCNATDTIPEPIMSRIRRFDVACPTPEQAARILQNIYEQIQLELNLALPMAPLSQDVVALLARVSPRRQKQLLREAIGRALLGGRTAILCSDLRLPRELGREVKRIGF